MPLGMEVGFGRGILCSMGTQLRPEKRAHPPHPIFGPCLWWPNGWMDKTPLGTEVDLGPGNFVLDGFPAIRRRGTAVPPAFFQPMSFVATVAHLSYC